MSVDLEKLDRTSSKEKVNVSSPQLIFVRGLPGSGKSFLSCTLARNLGAEHVSVIDPDTIVKDSEEYIDFTSNLTTNEPEVDPKFFPFRYLLFKSQQALESKKSVIWNQPFTELDGLRYTISSLVKFAESVNQHVNVIIIDIELTPEVVYARIERRINGGGHGPDLPTFQSFVSKFQESDTLGYKHLTVDGEKPLQTNINLILDRME